MKHTIAALFSVIACSASAQASVLTFEFTAIINTITQFEVAGFRITPLTSSALSGSTLSVGDSFIGRFSYNTESGVVYNYAQPGGSESYYGGYFGSNLDGNRVSGKFSPSAFGFDTGSKFNTNVHVIDSAAGGARDSIEITGYGVSPANTSQTLLVTLQDDDGTAFSSSALPQSLSTNMAGTFNYSYNIDSPGIISDQINGEITSLRQISAVPEVSSYVMLLAGAGLIGMVTRRRNRKYDA